MTQETRDFVESLSLEELKEEYLKLHQRYEDRGLAMQDTGEVIRGLHKGLLLNRGVGVFRIIFYILLGNFSYRRKSKEKYYRAIMKCE